MVSYDDFIRWASGGDDDFEFWLLPLFLYQLFYDELRR